MRMSQELSRKQLLKQYMENRLRWLQTLPEHPRKAQLADLRRGVGHAPGELPELWGAFLQEIPEKLQGKNDEDTPTKAEQAIYLALTLYALHQQGQTVSMYKEGEGLGKAARLLVPSGQEPGESSIQKRFNMLATATQMPEISHHLRGMIQLLRANGIPLDYVQLAADLYDLQIPEAIPCVRLRWGRDFYYDRKADQGETNE